MPVSHGEFDERCYYNNEVCRGELWTCVTCGEQYCQTHFHATDKGDNIECVACENKRLGEKRTIQCCVIGDTGCGPDLFFVSVRCDEHAYQAGKHYEAAKEWATQYCDPQTVIDDLDPGANVLQLGEWDTMSVIDLEGNEILNGRL